MQEVWQGIIIPEETRQLLLLQVAKLENVPLAEKDWHPGSNQQVLDLVHPSLFCFVKGVTREGVAHPPMKHIGGGAVNNSVCSI